jgi:hypothetical protein
VHSAFDAIRAYSSSIQGFGDFTKRIDVEPTTSSRMLAILPLRCLASLVVVKSHERIAPVNESEQVRS